MALSKAISHALRHDPRRYGLELDAGGWVPVGALLAGLARARRWQDVTKADLLEVARVSSKQRFEIDGDRIRARYGHSVPGRIAVSAALAPPTTLFHGTAAALVPVILAEGLRPMGRQYVHLSADPVTAAAVGRRKSRQVAVLRVRAGDAHAEGVGFWRGNELVWLAERVPAQFLAEHGGH